MHKKTMNFAQCMILYSCFRLYKCDVIRSKRDNAAFAKNFGGPLAAAEAPEDTSNETVGDAIFMPLPTQAPNPYAPTEAAVVTLDPPEILSPVSGCETRAFKHQVPVFLLPMPLPPPATRSSYLRYLALRRLRRSVEFANDGQNFEQPQQPVGPVAPPGSEDEETKLPTPPPFPLEMMQQVPEQPPPVPPMVDPQPLVVAAPLPVPVAPPQVLQPPGAAADSPPLAPSDSRPAAYAQLPPPSQVQQQLGPPSPTSQVEQKIVQPPPLVQSPPAPAAPQGDQQIAPPPVAQPPPSSQPAPPPPQPVLPQVQQVLAPPQPAFIPPPPPPAPQVYQQIAPPLPPVAQSLPSSQPAPPPPQPAPPQVQQVLAPQEPAFIPPPPPPAPQVYQQIAPPPPPLSPLNAGPPPLPPPPIQNLNNGSPPIFRAPPPPYDAPPPPYGAPPPPYGAPPPPYGAPPSAPYGAPRPPPPYGAPPPYYGARRPPPYGAPPPPPPPPRPLPTLPPIESFGVGSHVLVISIFCIHINDCIARCRAVQCNFIARNAVRFNTFLYKVQGSVLQTATYLPTPMWDSFALFCPEPEVQSGCVRFISVEDATIEFNNFIAKYEKKYKGDDDRKDVFPTFKDNLQVIQLLNCRRMSETDASFDVTQFSDMTFTQFASESGGALLPIGDKNLKPDLAGRGQQLISKCPKYNWADFGVVPAPRNQKKCGSCYAFSTSDMISTQWHIDHRMSGSFELSPQFLVDCSVAPAGLGCQGGRPIEVLKNLTRCDSLACNFPLEKCYPYTMVKGNCESKCPGSPKIGVYWATVADARGPNEKETIAAMLHWGPVVAIVDANQAWQFYSGAGAIGPEQCSKMQNHAVLIVGYDFRGPIPYYIIKNSWGTKWGSQGYLKLEAGTNACGVATNLVACCTHNCDDFKSLGTFPTRINSRGCI